MAEKRIGKGRVTLGEVVVAQMASWSLSDTVDVDENTTFEDESKAYSYGRDSWSCSIDGISAIDDTTGQEVLKDHKKNKTVAQDIRLYDDYSAEPGESVSYITPDTSINAAAGVLITGIERSKDTASQTSKISFSFQGSGPYKEVTETIPV